MTVHGQVATVTGVVDAGDLGVTQMHEHLISDFRMYLPPVEPGGHGAPDDFRTQSVCLGNLYEMKTRLMNDEVLRVDDIDDAVAEVAAFALEGGRTVVDATSIGIGRAPEALREVSARTGVNVVMGAGWYVVESMLDEFASRSVESLADEIVRDLTVGVGDSGIRAGFIGEVGLSWPHHPWEEKSLEAACVAQGRTGVALQIHPGRHPGSPLLAMDAVRRHGADPARTIICHVERTLNTVDEMVALAETGCMLEFDLFGQESSYYFVPSFTGMPNDAGRVRFIEALCDAGYADRILVSQDICTCVHLTRYGGEGLHHLLRRAVPLMRRMGLDDPLIERLLVRNPARVLTGVEPPT
jgi:phosphotriesterase-related protein